MCCAGRAPGAVEPLDAVVGIRAFTAGEQERWPAAGLTAGWSRGDWRLRPMIGAGGALDLVYGGSEIDLSAGLRWQDLRAGGARPLLGAGFARIHRSLGDSSGSFGEWFGQATTG